MLWARGRGGGIEVWSAGALEVCCKRVDVEVWASGGGQQVCRRGGVEVPEIRRPAPTRPNVVLVKSVEVWGSGVREACRRPGDVEVWRYGGALQACKCGGTEA